MRRLETLVTPNHFNFSMEYIDHNGNNLLVFEIMPPGYLVELKRELQTKTKTLDSGVVLVRKGQNTDEVRAASPSELDNLKDELHKFRSSSEYANFTNENDVESHRDRTIEKTIQSYMDKNTSYSLSEGFPIKKKSWKEYIIYEIYRLVDEFSSVKEFIYIHEKANQGKTFGDITTNHYLKYPELAIVLTERPKIKDIDKRKDNIKRLFKTKHVYFIDEFGYEFLYKDCILPYEKFDQSVFVDSFYENDEKENISALERLKLWFSSENEPLFVISGHGGIGKTTIAKQFLDYVYETHKNGVLFIDSKEIINELSRKFSSKNKICDVYDFYNALMDSDDDESSRFNRELLKLSIDNGSLIIALDGIDEVIAKLGDKFDVEKFITSIFDEYSSELNNTKILITCRDHFWNGVRRSLVIPEIKISPFDEKLALDFYAKKFNNDQKKIIKALDIANDFAIEYKDSEKNYIPFLVDIIARIVKSPTFTELNQVEQKSEYLSNTHNVDILISLICEREIVKLGTFSVDKQILFFMKMASEKANGISVYDVKNVLSDINVNNDELIIENFKGHPLIEFTDNKFIFRYDVFDTYFKSLLIVNYFKKLNVDSLDEKMIDIISGYIKYDSSFTRSVSEKFTFSDELLFFMLENIEKIKSISPTNCDLFISSLVILSLDVVNLDQSYKFDTETRTSIIEKLFSHTKNTIDGLCLVDVFGNATSKIIFDFRNKKLINCTFNNYQYFWECLMNSNTRFEKSFFKDIDPRDGIKYIIHDNMFSNDCDLSHIKHLINEKKQENENSLESIRSDVLKAFKIFYKRGNFYPRKQEEVRKKLATISIFSYMIDNQVIIKFKDPQKPTMQQYNISKKYKTVIDFIEQGIPSEELNTLVENIQACN
ncbi:NACHT domain-containing protein [Pectobacterium colocasium]|uniref:NACHT domain-containing protein n=1 Tax=Pectobacterium colocasium TaxID=2878098 RepID=UPI001CD22585|nr:NACHT domain-containing protein [Pectobacterium colocasium]